ncbi:hypothetical protein, partial [Burkholderia cepacia]|uniref:hypothetical protein n=1 Tax=Burkholderia cepacia TaxID=292 RepID=UPI002ABE6ABA
MDLCHSVARWLSYQRSSHAADSNTRTGLPSAPARRAGPVSTVIGRSSASKMTAVSPGSITSSPSKCAQPGCQRNQRLGDVNTEIDIMLMIIFL